jgi:hypothetical protein
MASLGKSRDECLREYIVRPELRANESVRYNVSSILSNSRARLRGFAWRCDKRVQFPLCGEQPSVYWG